MVEAEVMRRVDRLLRRLACLGVGVGLGLLAASAFASTVCSGPWQVVNPDSPYFGFQAGNGASLCSFRQYDASCTQSGPNDGESTDGYGNHFIWARQDCVTSADPAASSAVLSDSQSLNFLAYGFLVGLVGVGYIGGRLR
jgi:hypothetical protein